MAVILLADDSDDDVFLIRRTLQTANIINPLRVVHDGEQALAYLKGEPPYHDREAYPLPELLLLDLKMPRVDGFQVLAWLRQQPEWRKLPVAVLTSSTDVRDANAAFALGANSFLIKPMDFMRFAEFAQAMAGSWLWVSQVPANGAPPASVCAAEVIAA